jgi:hypothetical protein
MHERRSSGQIARILGWISLGLLAVCVLGIVLPILAIMTSFLPLALVGVSLQQLVPLFFVGACLAAVGAFAFGIGALVERQDRGDAAVGVLAAAPVVFIGVVLMLILIALSHTSGSFFD